MVTDPEPEPTPEPQPASVCPWCGCVGYHADDCPEASPG